MPKRKIEEVEEGSEGSEGKVRPVKKAQIASIFDPLPLEISVEDGYFQQYRPTQATFIPCQFFIPPSSNFIDLSQCTLELGMQLVKTDDTAMGATEIDVGVINNIGHSVIKRFDVKLNDTSTGEPTDLYHMKAYVQNLCNFTTEQKDTYLANEGWYTDDTPGTRMNSNKTVTRLDQALPASDAAYNKGFLERSKLFFTKFGKTGQASREATFIIQPCVDIFQSGRFLVPGVSIDIQIDFNDPALVLMAAADATHKFKITKAIFNVRHVRVAPSVHLDVENKQKHQQLTARYPIRTTKPIRRTLEKDKQSFSFPDIFQQAVPDSVTIALVNSTNMGGSYNTTPFQFEQWSLSEVRWLVNGQERPGARLEIKSPDRMEAYETLFTSTGNHHRGFSPGIKRADYKNGFAVMSFNFRPDGKDGKNYTYKKNQGTLDLFLEFKSVLPHNITLVLLPEFENEILIDANKVVTMAKNY